MPFAALGGFASFFLGLFRAFSEADYAAEAHRLQRELADAEAGRVEAEAEQLLQESGLRAQDYRDEGFRVHGQQLLAYARSGVRLTGTPSARLSETEARIEEGRRRILQRSEFQAGQLQSRAASVRAAAEVGINPNAVLISHLPNLVSSALQFGQAIAPQQPLPPPNYGPSAQAPTRGAQYSAARGGGSGPAARAFFPRVIDIS